MAICLDAGSTPAVSIFRKVEKNKKELKPLFYKVLALFFYKQEKARYLPLHSFPCYDHNKEKDNLSSKSLFDAYIFLYILELIFLTSDHINLN